MSALITEQFVKVAHQIVGGPLADRVYLVDGLRHRIHSWSMPGLARGLHAHDLHCHTSSIPRSVRLSDLDSPRPTELCRMASLERSTPASPRALPFAWPLAKPFRERSGGTKVSGASFDRLWRFTLCWYPESPDRCRLLGFREACWLLGTGSGENMALKSVPGYNYANSCGWQGAGRRIKRLKVHPMVPMFTSVQPKILDDRRDPWSRMPSFPSHASITSASSRLCSLPSHCWCAHPSV